MCLALDWYVFGKCYLDWQRNCFGVPLTLRLVPAKYTRRDSELNTYWFIR